MIECQVFIPFWCWTDNKWAFYFTEKLLENIKAVTDDRIPYEVIIFEDHSHPDCAREVDEKFGDSGARIIHFHEGENLVQRGRNKINSLVEAPFYAIFHPDTLLTRGWLFNMVCETKLAELKFKKPCVIAPTFLPYPMYEPEMYQIHKNGDLFGSPHETELFCRKYGIPFEWKDGVLSEVLSMGPSISSLTDDGHRLMMYVASKSYAQFKGSEWDERYKSGGYEDNDVGISTIINGGKNLQSHTTFVHHMIGHSRSAYAQTNAVAVNNKDTFIAKWGRQMWDDMETGQLWIRLHKEYA